MAENMQLEGYTDLERIGRGGMATIYRGHQTSLNRTVAIKFLSAEHLWDHKAQELFDQESLVIAQLNHPNIIHVIDRGFSAGGRPYFVMEYVEGQTLAEKMQHTSMTPLARVLLSMQICAGLAYAHKNGVIHRDIKPANLLIDDEGHLRILDFGIAWLNARGNPDGQEVLGTPDYMSPEQFTAPDLINSIAEIIDDTGVDSRYIELELTENALFENVDTGTRCAHELKAYGLQLSIDDFGTGYSSLQLLKRLPVDTLKIDQSFIHDILADSENALIVKSAIALGQGLGVRVVAEGVELHEQLTLLQELGCDEVQGYLLGRPVPAQEIYTRLATNPKDALSH